MTLAGCACICMCLWWCQSSGSQKGPCDPRRGLHLLYLSILKRPHTVFMHTHTPPELLFPKAEKIPLKHAHKTVKHMKNCTHTSVLTVLSFNLSHTEMKHIKQILSERNWKWEEGAQDKQPDNTHTHTLLLFTMLQICSQNQAKKHCTIIYIT